MAGLEPWAAVILGGQTQTKAQAQQTMNLFELREVEVEEDSSWRLVQSRLAEICQVETEEASLVVLAVKEVSSFLCALVGAAETLVSERLTTDQQLSGQAEEAPLEPG